ncbi:MAG: hypothetical protein KJP02_11855, partial [Octadecabacter sp.]|nr:hypothetical protein [Octadecabacter sp.]
PEPSAIAEVCGGVGDLAADTMRQRQNGAAMSDMMAVAETEMQRDMVGRAFSFHRWAGLPDMQRDEVIDFRNAWEMWCFQILMSE